MDGEHTRRNTQNQSADVSAAEGWTTTKAAGKALGVSPRTVQSYIKKGYLVGKVEGEGVRRTWYVSIDSLNSLRAQRLAESDKEYFRESATGQVAEGLAEAMQNLSERLAEASAQAAEYRTRLELTERTESTLREDLERERTERREVRGELAEERLRREQVERERDELALRLEVLQEPPDAPESATEPEPSTETPASDTGQPRRSWWRRFFGFE
jgi:hypothetical protein